MAGGFMGGPAGAAGGVGDIMGLIGGLMQQGSVNQTNLLGQSLNSLIVGAGGLINSNTTSANTGLSNTGSVTGTSSTDSDAGDYTL